MEVIDTKEIELQITTVSTQAMSMTVTDMTSYQSAGQVLLAFKDMEKHIKDKFEKPKKETYQAWKGICNWENEELAKLSPGVAHLNKTMATYKIAEDAKRGEQEEILRQEAIKAEEERRLQEALQAEKEGKKEEAEIILETPIFVPPPILETQAPKINGLGMQTNWKFRIININIIPREYLMPDEVKIGGVVRALKQNCKILGIEPYPEQSMKKVRAK